MIETRMVPEQTERETYAPPPRRMRRAIAPIIGYFALICAASALAVTFFGAQTYHWRAFSVEVSIRPALTGRTSVILSPLGEISAATHRAPTAFTVALTGVSYERLKELFTPPIDRPRLEREFRAETKRDLRGFALRQIAIGALGALLVPLYLRPKRGRVWALSAFVGGAAVACMLSATAYGFNRNAFQNATYTGSLREAKWALALAKEAFNNAETLSHKLTNIADNLNTLYGRINAMPGLSSDIDTQTILHVSDIHNNAAAIRFVQDLVKRLRVSAVVDTGDLTDFGTPLETHLAGSIAQLGVPYVYIAGNHDSMDTIRALKRGKNVIVLDNSSIAVAGVTILGAPDPGIYRTIPANVETPEAQIRAADDRLLCAFTEMALKPDIVAVHNVDQARSLIGKAAIILCGHTHVPLITDDRHTVICNAGTSGASGARYFEKANGIAFSAEILSYTRTLKPKLVYIDQVILDGNLGRYSISRRTLVSAPAPRLPMAGKTIANRDQ